MGGAVVYTRASRTELLRVTEAEFAAMTGITPSTEPYALLFARKIKERLDTTWAIGETGTAGPTGSRYRIYALKAKALSGDPASAHPPASSNAGGCPSP